jgi:hypothetical protein
LSRYNYVKSRKSDITSMKKSPHVPLRPTDPLILAKQAARRNLNCSDSSGNSLVRTDDSRWAWRNSRRLKSSDTVNRVYCNWYESYLFGVINVQLSIMANLCPRHRPQSSIKVGGTIRPSGVCQLSQRRQL